MREIGHVTVHAPLEDALQIILRSPASITHLIRTFRDLHTAHIFVDDRSYFVVLVVDRLLRDASMPIRRFEAPEVVR